MALRILSCVLAFSLALTTGCANRSNYQPACCRPAVVATAPACGPACPPAPVAIVPPPPQPAVFVQQR